ncbi:MAG: SAM-dependent methyltransferase [Methanospirillaceae archaeon]|nr:SAM-dependent methyltransferase [Methanospirillaceae archaeon]
MKETEDGDIRIKKVGIIRNDRLLPPLVAGVSGLHHNPACVCAMKDMKETDNLVSEIILAQEFTHLLDGIEEYSHLVILYWGHEVPESGRALQKVHPAGLTLYPVQGIFATCSPARPNPIHMKVARLLRRDAGCLYVSGLDAINNSPVLDIKPFIPESYPVTEACIPDWMKQVMAEFHRGQ